MVTLVVLLVHRLLARNLGVLASRLEQVGWTLLVDVDVVVVDHHNLAT